MSVWGCVGGCACARVCVLAYYVLCVFVVSFCVCVHLHMQIIVGIRSF